MRHDKQFISRAQTMMEYILLMCVVVVIVFLAFRKGGGGVLEQTQGKVSEYFDTGSTAIMGGYFVDSETGGRITQVNPNAVDGGWCAWSACVDGFKARECACPRPAFGGKACDKSSSNSEGRDVAVTPDGCGGQCFEKTISIDVQAGDLRLGEECSVTQVDNPEYLKNDISPWCPVQCPNVSNITTGDRGCPYKIVKRFGEDWCQDFDPFKSGWVFRKKWTCSRVERHCVDEPCTVGRNTGVWQKDQTCSATRGTPPGGTSGGTTTGSGRRG